MRMLLRVWGVLALVWVLALPGCKSKPRAMAMDSAFGVASARSAMPAATSPRMLVWNADLTVEVWNVSNAVAQAISLTQGSGGYVEQKSGSGEESARLRLRLPIATFTNALGALEALGTVQYRYLQAQDVTEEYVDTDARLKNLVVLRDRLRQLLEKATEVKDLLAIEGELSRIQGEIDSMENRMKLLKGQVDLAALDLTLQRKQILGPLGYLVKGVWWTIEKLFILRN